MEQIKKIKKTLKQQRVMSGMKYSHGPLSLVKTLQIMDYEKKIMCINVKHGHVTLIPNSLKLCSAQFYNYYDCIQSIINNSITYDTKHHFLKECLPQI